MSAFWTDRRVFLTGATGFLGSRLAELLVTAGADVIALVRDDVARSNLEMLRETVPVTIVHGEVEDALLLERVVGEYEVKTVVHLAAQTIVGIANRNPRSTFESNVRGTWNLLEACRQSSLVEQIVVASSDKAYGEHPVLPYTEEAPLQGRHPYDVSKSCADLIAQSYRATFALPVCITRCGNLFGGGDLNWNRVVPGTIRSIVRGERPVIRSDGQYIRDYVYVRDAAAAVQHLIERMAADPQRIVGEAFNISSGVHLTVIELVEKIRALMQSSSAPDVRNEATHEIRNQYLSSEKASRLLGWSPQYTVDEGLRETIEWYRHYLAASD